MSAIGLHAGSWIIVGASYLSDRSEERYVQEEPVTNIKIKVFFRSSKFQYQKAVSERRPSQKSLDLSGKEKTRSLSIQRRLQRVNSFQACIATETHVPPSSFGHNLRVQIVLWEFCELRYAILYAIPSLPVKTSRVCSRGASRNQSIKSTKSHRFLPDFQHVLQPKCFACSGSRLTSAAARMRAVNPCTRI